VTLTLNTAATTATSVGWTTVAGSAAAGADFQAASGIATFAAGSTTATITVYLVGDTTYEPNETFSVKLTSWGTFNLADGVGAVTIANDDPVPLTVSVGNATTTEGNKGTTTVNVPVTLSRAASSTVTVVVKTIAGTALAGGDFVATTQTLTFAAGVTTVNFVVSIVGDTKAEPVETFTVQLSSPTGGASIETGTGTVTIVDNDGAMFAAQSSSGAEQAPLTADVLAPVLAQAEAAWRTALPGARFDGVTVTIADLPGDLLGFTLGKAVTIDPTAAGWGWLQVSGGTLRMDLLAVLEHELGLTLGFTEADPLQPIVMARTLAPGTIATAPFRMVRPVARGPISAHAVHTKRKATT
jgi:hypothetical protein